MERLVFGTKIVIDENGKAKTLINIEQVNDVDINLLSRMVKVAKQNEAKYQKEIDAYLSSNGLNPLNDDLEDDAEQDQEDNAHASETADSAEQ